MVKKIVLGLLAMTVLTWAVFAQAGFGQTAPAAFNGGNAFAVASIETFAAPAQSAFGTSALLTPLQEGGVGAGARIPWGANTGIAGLTNAIGGIWSWTNGDIMGGAIIAGLEIIGIPLGIIGAQMLARDAASPGFLSDSAPAIFTGMAIGGPLLALGGAVFGVYRGVTQYNKMAADAGISLAKADSPMDNLTVAMLPTGNGLVGQVAYTVRW